MSPEQLHNLYLENGPAKIAERRKKELKNAVDNILLAAITKIKRHDNTECVRIVTHGDVYSYDIYEELKKQGYHVTESHVGFEEDSEDYYYLHFQLNKPKLFVPKGDGGDWSDD